MFNPQCVCRITNPQVRFLMTRKHHKAYQEKVRQSNFELLRIISIFLIMVVHANYKSFGMPQPEDIRQTPFLSLLYVGLENISIVCVDVFVLLSGWFGVQTKFKSIGGLIFQCIFFNLLLCILLPVLGISQFSISAIGQSFFSYPHFVICYTVMYILTPVLNSFIEHATKKSFALFLSVYYTWAFIFGWLLWKDEGFFNGNTTLSFVGLYMLARFIRLHTDLPRYSARFWTISWLITVGFVSLLSWGICMTGINDHLGIVLLNITGSYLAPNVIFASICLILIFSKIQFTSKFVNWVAVSAFSSVLLHGYMMDELYVENVLFLHSQNPLWLFIILAFGMMIGYLLIGTIVDKVRIWFWNKILSIIQPLIDEI